MGLKDLFLKRIVVKKLLIILLLLPVVPLSAQLSYPYLTVLYDSVMEYKNLRIIPVKKNPQTTKDNPQYKKNHLPIISLEQALKEGKAKIKERGDNMLFDINSLVIENNSDQYLLVMAGEVLAGGRQDRIVSKDTLLLPRTKKNEVNVLCVEDGRWSRKEGRFRHEGGAQQSFRMKIDSGMNQQQVWKFIRRQLQKNKIDTETESYLNIASNKKVMDTANEYFRYFSSRFKNSDSSYMGFVCMSGDKVLGSDLFIEPGLFYSELNYLLRGYITEAVLNGAALTVSENEVNRYIDQLLGQQSQPAFIKKRGKIFTAGGQLIHINTY